MVARPAVLATWCMTLLHEVRRRLLATVVPSLALLAVAVLGGCSVSGGMSGTIGEAGARVGANVDFAILDAARRSGTRQQHDVKTVYVVPDYKASP